MKTILELSKEINANARAKGFWKDGINVPQKLLLIISEVTEAMEADRENKYGDPYLKSVLYKLPNTDWQSAFEAKVKNTFQDELADAAIRIFDLAYEMGIDLQWHIEQKMRYNESRQYLHGGKKY